VRRPVVWSADRVDFDPRARDTGGVVHVWKPVAFAVTLGLALPAVSSAETLNVAPAAPDDAGSTAGCSAQSGGSFSCVTLRDAFAFAKRWDGWS
jgi:hypothetical protein